MKRLIFTLCLACAILLSACTSSENTPDEDLKAGILLDVNGQVYQAGKAFKAAVELAAEDINHNLQKNGFSKRIRLFIEDTQGQPQLASQKIENFKKEGIIPVFSGSSGEISAVMDYAQKNNLILLSGFSTAPSLAQKDSNLFRFCMNDNQQAKALVRFAQENGIESAVIVYRDDVYGNDLKNMVTQTGRAAGLDIDQEEKYSPDETNFSTMLKRVEEKLKQEESENPGSRVAVILISMNEVVDIFKAAAGNAGLEAARWIGCDAVAPDSALFSDNTVREFAGKTGYTVCNFGINLDSIKKPFAGVPSRLQSLTGSEEVPAAAYYYYDAMWVLAQAWLNTAQSDFILLKQTIPDFAHILSLCSDEIGMDEYGDRTWGQYFFWTWQNGKFEKSAGLVFGDWSLEGQYTQY